MSQVSPVPEVKAAVSQVNPAPEVKPALFEANSQEKPAANQIQRLKGKSRLDEHDSPTRSNAEAEVLDTPDAKDPAKGACYKAGLGIC